jgi:hypothetical protein
MFDYQTVKLLHHHGNQDWVAMAPSPADHDPASHDPERAWLEGATIYKCTQCDEEVVLAPPDDRPGYSTR